MGDVFTVTAGYLRARTGAHAGTRASSYEPDIKNTTTLIKGWLHFQSINSSLPAQNKLQVILHISRPHFYKVQAVGHVVFQLNCAWYSAIGGLQLCAHYRFA